MRILELQIQEMPMNNFFKNTFMFLFFGLGIASFKASEEPTDDQATEALQEEGQGAEAPITEETPATDDAAEETASTASSANNAYSVIFPYMPKSNKSVRELLDQAKKVVPENINAAISNFEGIYEKRKSILEYLSIFIQNGLSDRTIQEVISIFAEGTTEKVDNFIKFMDGLKKSVTSVPSSLNIDFFFSAEINELVIKYFALVKERDALNKSALIVPNSDKMNPKDFKNKLEQMRKQKEDELKELQGQIDKTLITLLDILCNDKSTNKKFKNAKLNRLLNQYPAFMRNFIKSFGEDSALIIERLFRVYNLSFTGVQRSYIENPENTQKYLGKLFFNVYMDLVIMKTCLTISESNRKTVIGKLANQLLPLVPDKNKLKEPMYQQLRNVYGTKPAS